MLKRLLLLHYNKNKKTMNLFTQNIENQQVTEFTSSNQNSQTTENQEVKVLYMNDQRSPFTLYCSHIGYIKGFNRVVDAFTYIASEEYAAWLVETCAYLEEDIKKVKLQVIEHLEEHGKKDKVIVTLKPLDVLKTRYDNI